MVETVIVLAGCAAMIVAYAIVILVDAEHPREKLRPEPGEKP